MPMTARERITAVLNFERPDRMPLIEWATWWDQTLRRWKGEGLPEHLGGVDLMRHFGLDPMAQSWWSPRTHLCPSAAGHGGGIVQSADDYDRLVAGGALYWAPNANGGMFETFDRHRESHDRGEIIFWYTLEGFFWFPRTLFGIEDHLYAFVDHPELMKRINQDLANHSLRILEALAASPHRPAFMTFAEDMSYNHGCMISEAMFDEFMLPYYRQVIPAIRGMGTKIFVDSDGDISRNVDWFAKAGIEGVLPLERQAGVDVAAIRQSHPKFLMLGAYDKMVMNRGKEAIAAEFARLAPTARKGGLVAGVDHQTPPGVSLAQYMDYLDGYRDFAAAAACL